MFAKSDAADFTAAERAAIAKLLALVERSFQ
jgi:hypothetical protein